MPLALALCAASAAGAPAPPPEDAADLILRHGTFYPVSAPGA